MKYFDNPPPPTRSLVVIITSKNKTVLISIINHKLKSEPLDAPTRIDKHSKKCE